MTKRHYFIIYLFITIIIILWFIKTEQQSALYINEAKIVSLGKQIEHIKNTNGELRNQLLGLRSLTTIEQQAKKQGYKQASYIYFR
jgi:cell division protein FtsL